MERLAKKLYELGYCIDRHNDFSHKLCTSTTNKNIHQTKLLKLSGFLVKRQYTKTKPIFGDV